MKSPRTGRSTKASPDDARKPPGVTHVTRHRRGMTAGASANADRERALIAREEAVARRERALRRQEATVRASHSPTQTRADIDRLMGQLREANERLIVAAVQAQNLSDEAHTETAQAREEIDHLLNQLRSANERLAAGAAQAHAMTEEARAREEEYRRLSGRLLTVQDEERRRLALDLHDSTGQRLAALTMNLDIAGRATRALDARSRRALAESRTLAEACAREVRTFAYLLHPPLLEEAGLLSALRWYAEGFAKRSGIHVVVDLDEVGRLPRPIETALFRVVQESLTNVHRHASATTASIRLTLTADVVALEIHDQGHGRPDPLAHQTGMLPPETLGVGIQGMRERIRQLGGTFDVEFTDKGTTVYVGVPLNTDTP
jgi:signal transduction histidine kinase